MQTIDDSQINYDLPIIYNSQIHQLLSLFLIRHFVIGGILIQINDAICRTHAIPINPFPAPEFISPGIPSAIAPVIAPALPPILGCLYLTGRLLKYGLILAIACFTNACSLTQNLTQPAATPRTIQIHQTFQFQPGDRVAEHRIVAGLGDISIDLNGDPIYAPFNGQIQPNIPNCILFSSPDIPAYLFRFCGLENPRLGTIQQGEAIGSAKYLHFATLRKEEDGTWSMVEPARDILERLLKPS